MAEQKTVYVNTKPPKKFHCPECACDKTKAKLIFKRSTTSQWGCVVSRYDYYRCPSCKERFVSSNGGRPAITTGRRV